MLVIDDDPFTRTVLESTLAGIGCSIVASAGTATDALRAARDLRPDVAVIDLDLGAGPTGIDVARALRRVLPALGIVMLSTYEDPRLLGRNQPPLPPGSVYLVKRSLSTASALAGAVSAVAASPLGSADEPGEPSTSTGTGMSAVDGLSDQQIELLRLIAAGLSNAEIARRRFVAEPTVEKAVARLIRHFGLQAGKSHNQRVLLAQAYFELTGSTRARAE